jgi:hypothetical protein
MSWYPRCWFIEIYILMLAAFAFSPLLMKEMERRERNVTYF